MVGVSARAAGRCVVELIREGGLGVARSRCTSGSISKPPAEDVAVTLPVASEWKTPGTRRPSLYRAMTPPASGSTMDRFPREQPPT